MGGGGSKLSIERVSTKLRRGFTLAEVLITLAIIGVVAAITMPVLIQKYRNHVVETRLEKFYSVMNQAIKMSEAEYGPKETWDLSIEDYWEKYFKPYVKTVSEGQFSDGSYIYRTFYFPGGDMLVMEHKTVSSNSVVVNSGNQIDFYYYPDAKNFSESTFSRGKKTSQIGKTNFVFQFFPTNSSYYHYHRGFEPFANILNQDLSNLTSGNSYSCNESATYKFYCTFMIYSNGWKIPSNYPFKVR